MNYDDLTELEIKFARMLKDKTRQERDEILAELERGLKDD